MEKQFTSNTKKADKPNKQAQETMTTDPISNFLKGVPDKLLTPAEEFDLANKIHDLSMPPEKNRYFLDKLVKHNLKYVITVSKKFQDRGLSIEDLLQEGCLGLQIAATKFKPFIINDEGRWINVRFTTYATWWIRQSIMRAIYNTSTLVRLPVYSHEILHKINRVVREHADGKCKKTLSIKELAKRTGKSEIRIKTALNARLIASTPVSLDLKPMRSRGEDGDATLADMISDSRCCPDEEVIKQEIKERLEIAMYGLKSHERFLLVECGQNGNSYVEAGKMLHEAGIARRVLSRERIRQIYNNALLKVRRNVNSSELRELLEHFD